MRRISVMDMKRLLRSPALITAETVVITLAGVLGAAFPQASTSGGAELARLRETAPALARAGLALGLDDVFHSAWFLASMAVTALSLLVVVYDQVQRLRLDWSRPADAGSFRSAPYRAEFTRPARPGGPGVRVRSEQRLGAAGGPLLHIGLLAVILAGVSRALFSSEAAVELLEGETLPMTSSAWNVQKPGTLAEPIRLEQTVTIGSVDAHRYRSGDLRDLAIGLQLSDPRAGTSREVDIPVNGSVEAGGTRLYVGSDYGPAALVEWRDAAGTSTRTAALLKHERGDRFELSVAGAGGAQAHLRASVERDGARPGGVEVRVMEGGALMYAGTIFVGETAALPGGETLTLHGLPFWVRLHASRDPSLWLMYLGMALLVGGVTLLYTCIRVDLCVSVEPAGELERVFVALEPQRLAPLFADRFRRAVEEEGGNPAVLSAGPAEHPFPLSRGRACAARPVAGAAQPVFLLAVACVLGLTGCGGASRNEARRLVERYNDAVSEAYRRGDVKLVDNVVGPEEGRKLLGLIGVRLDLGLTLDSKMQSLEILDVASSGDKMQVRTRERWQYCDRRIGTGEQVGDLAEDRYVMLYHFARDGKEWLVERIEFAERPVIGRRQAPWETGHGAMVQAAAVPPGPAEGPAP